MTCFPPESFRAKYIISRSNFGIEKSNITNYTIIEFMFPSSLSHLWMDPFYLRSEWNLWRIKIEVCNMTIMIMRQRTRDVCYFNFYY